MRKRPEFHNRVEKEAQIDGRHRSGLCPGAKVKVVQKQDQASGRTTEGRVKEILTRSTYHPHGIKVRLEDGTIGRVKDIC
ncbi:MAG TPA: YwbE family protein [Methanolinea sp.]|nr:YwbE family protein [Methanolinea sp.]HQK56208.1 YwbE family protein [Methanolinea sp.]